jgi:hypothetical protein
LDSFRSPPSTRIDPFYLTQIQLYLFVELVLYKLDVPVYKKVYYLKQRSLLVLHIFVLPGLLTRVYTQSSNFLPDFLLGLLPGFLLGSVPDSLPESYPKPYPSRYPECVTRNITRVLPRHVPDWVIPSLPQRLPGWVKSYLIVYPTLHEAYPAG